jgi:hypothetical protein
MLVTAPKGMLPATITKDKFLFNHPKLTGMKISKLLTASILILSCATAAISQTHSWVKKNPGGGGAFNIVKAGPTGIILVGSDMGGAMMSQDNGLSFTTIGFTQGLQEAHIGGIGFNPVNQNTMFIGTENGLYRSTNKGVSFSLISSVPAGYITDIVVCKSDTNRVYVSWQAGWNTPTTRLYRSLNGGASFTNAGSTATTQYTGQWIEKLISNPANKNILYYVTSMTVNVDNSTKALTTTEKLYKSIDSGKTFTAISGTLGKVEDMDINPLHPDSLYMTIYTSFPAGKFYVSGNAGSVWTQKSSVTGAIFVKATEPWRIRRIDPTATAGWNATSGTWESTNLGANWTQTGFVNTGYNTGYNKDVISHVPTNDVFHSYGSAGFQGMIKGMGRDMSNPDVILWANDQYLYRSTNGGVSFTPIHTKQITTGLWQSTGIDNSNVVDIAVSDANPNVIYAGFFDMGFWHSIDGGNTWQSGNDSLYTSDDPNGPWEGFGGNVISIAADPARPNVVFATQSNFQEGGAPTYLLRSTNYGVRGSWTLSNTGLPTSEVMGLSIDRLSNPTDRIMYVTAAGNVYKRWNEAASWILLNVAGSGLPSGGFRFTAVDSFNSQIVYAGGGSGLYVSVNGGTNWAKISTTAMDAGNTSAFWGGNGFGVFDIAPDPQVSGTVYVTVYGTGKGLYRGVRNGTTGTSWTFTQLYVNDYMRKVAINPLNDNYVYATSSSAFTDGSYYPGSVGIVFSNNKFATYSVVTGNTTFPFASTVKVDRANNVYFGSLGTGILKSAIPLTPLAASNHQTPMPLEINPGIVLYPNPVSKTLYIGNAASIKGNFNIEVYDMLGKKQLSIANPRTSIDLGQLARGMYFISVKGEQVNYSQKLIKL